MCFYLLTACSPYKQKNKGLKNLPLEMSQDNQDTHVKLPLVL